MKIDIIATLKKAPFFLAPLWTRMNVAPRDLNPLAHSRKASNFDRNEHYYFVHSVRFHEKP